MSVENCHSWSLMFGYVEQHKGPNTFIFLIDIGDMEAFGVSIFLENKTKQKHMLGKICRTAAQEASLWLGEHCSNLTMNYLQKQACLETKRNESNCGWKDAWQKGSGGVE